MIFLGQKYAHFETGFSPFRPICVELFFFFFGSATFCNAIIHTAQKPLPLRFTVGDRSQPCTLTRGHASNRTIPRRHQVVFLSYIYMCPSDLCACELLFSDRSKVAGRAYRPENIQCPSEILGRRKTCVRHALV